MEKAPFFSVGIPVYNKALWLGECLDSVLSQSFSDFEVICIDDGSRDESLEILKSYRQKDKRIKVFHRENGGSASNARNAMIRLSSGIYLRTVDADDRMCPDNLKNAYEAIVNQGYPDLLQAGFIKRHFGNEIPVMPKRPFSRRDFEEEEGRSLTKDEYAALLFLRDEAIGMVSSKFIKREFLNLSGLVYNPLYLAREDGDFTYRLLRKAGTIGMGEFFSYVYWLPRPGSVSTEESDATKLSIVRYYSDFYRAVDSWELSGDILARVKRKREREFPVYGRKYLVGFFKKGRTKKERLDFARQVSALMGDMIKKMPAGGDGAKNFVIYSLFKILGIKNTMRILYYYLKLRGIV